MQKTKALHPNETTSTNQLSTLSHKEQASYCGTNIIMGGNVALLGALLPYMYDKGIISNSQASLVQTLQTFSIALCSIIMGMVMHKFTTRKIYVAGYIGLAIAFIVYTLTGFIGSALLVGIAAVLLLGANTIINNIFNYDFNARVHSDPKANNTVNVFFAIAGILTPILVSFSVQLSGSWSLFLLFLLVILICVAFMMLSVQKKQPLVLTETEQQQAKGKNPMLAHPGRYFIFILMFGSTQMFQLLFTGWTALFLIQSHITTIAVAQTLMSVFWLGKFLSSLIIYPFFLKYIKSNVFLVMCGTVMLLGSTGLFFAKGALLYPLVLICGLAFGGIIPTNTASLAQFAEGHRNVFAYNQFFSAIIAMIGTFSIGNVFEKTGSYTGYMLVPGICVVYIIVNILKVLSDKKVERNSLSDHA